MLGMNDGRYRAYDPDMFQEFSGGFEHIIIQGGCGLMRLRDFHAFIDGTARAFHWLDDGDGVITLFEITSAPCRTFSGTAWTSLTTSASVIWTCAISFDQYVFSPSAAVEPYWESSTSQKTQARSNATKGSVISGTLPGRNICAASIAPSVAAATTAAYRIRHPLLRNSQTNVP
jgi:hypothetical protein